ncbi:MULTISPECIES: helix-turn-helix domain-containing protein [Kitasatospora]|uniref:Helix-turn-helix domain-containing protein n=1 Tax=Kitasatospora setae (strain ATCC 33774 / DSM 43861 / JCM 3304 / KCC A-0304 / NBRC 14216 / KM-6054) TaxID=452652 RepID=E4N2J0_KITSK|nr:hypothetical protein KSE_66150 [Kitasatospora setae KM-6054]
MWFGQAEHRPTDSPPTRTQQGVHLGNSLMTVDEVANHLSRPKSWVYANWREAGIPFRRVGQALRCRPKDLEAWVDQQNP